MTPATACHAAALAAVHAAAVPPGQRWDAAAMAEVLAMPGVAGWLDARGGLLLARCAGGEAEILALAVIPAARRAGLGRKLLDTALAAFADTPVFLEVAADNAAAQALYRAAGFEPCGRRPGYYGPGRDALLLRHQPRRITTTVVPSGASLTDSTA